MPLPIMLGGLMEHDPLCPSLNCIDRTCEYCCRCDLIAKVRDYASSAAELEAWRDVYETIKDGHRGNGSALRDICCQICQEIECDNDCPVGESVDREARAYNQGQRNMLAKCIEIVEAADLCGQNRCNVDAPNALHALKEQP